MRAWCGGGGSHPPEGSAATDLCDAASRGDLDWLRALVRGGTPAHGFGGKGIERDPIPFLDPRSGYVGPAALVDSAKGRVASIGPRTRSEALEARRARLRGAANVFVNTGPSPGPAT